MAEALVNRHIRIITNSLPVFTILNKSKTVDLILIGGEYRAITGAFVGSLASQTILSLKFAKAFISCNGIYKNDIATYSENEGVIQRLACDNAIENTCSLTTKSLTPMTFTAFITLTISTPLSLTPRLVTALRSVTANLPSS